MREASQRRVRRRAGTDTSNKRLTLLPLPEAEAEKNDEARLLLLSLVLCLGIPGGHSGSARLDLHGRWVAIHRK